MPDMASNELRRCIKELGLKGVKIHPEQHCFTIDSLCAGGYPGSFMETVVELQEQMGTPIPIVSHGMTTFGAQPDQFAKLAADYPTVPITIGHGAGFQGLFFAGLDRAKACPNLYYDTAMLTADDAHLLGVAQQVGVEKIIFGSDHFNKVHENLYGNLFYALERAFPDRHDLELVLGGNLRRIMGV